MKPTPEQYREAACALIGAGAPLEARSGPGEHVQFLAPASGAPGAYVEVFVWVTEDQARAGEAGAAADAKRRLRDFMESVERTERLVAMNR